MIIYLVNSPAFAHPQIQQHHLLTHQRSASFGSNLYQQSTNHFGPHSGFQPQVSCINKSIIIFSLTNRYHS
jgi:hypothetical protein